jgi:transcriptional regulator with XRE-family HTH domain
MNIDISDNILSIIESNIDLSLGVAGRVRERRLEMNLTQKGFAARAGIPLATYRRFERSGEISLSNLILVAYALGMTLDIEKLFSERRYENIDAVINAESVKKRKRGKRND